VFGVRKVSSYEYFDEFKFKVCKKGEFKFIMGTKVPNLVNHTMSESIGIQCRLFVWIDGLTDNPLQSELNLSIRAPKIVCPKELTMVLGERAIMISAIKNKPKKDCRIPFRVSDSFTDGRTIPLEV
jgi:hypothetical protein